MNNIPSRLYLFTGVLLAAVMFAMSQFYRSSVAVISPDLMQEMGLSALDLSRISAAFFYAFALMQIPVGIFLDTVGPKIAMAGLTLVSVAGAVIFALGTSPAWLTFGRVLLGIGMACNFMGSLKLLTLWFEPRQFATLSAILVSLGTLGNIAAATPLVLLVGWVGWRHSFLIIAGFTLLLALVFLAVIREQSGGTDTAKSGEETDDRPRVSQTLSQAWGLFHRKDYWIISMATFCRYGIYAAVQALWAGPFLIHVLELSAVTAGNILFLMNIGLIVGCPVCGWLSDSVVGSRKKVIIPGMVCMVGLLLGLNRLTLDTGVWVVHLMFFFVRPGIRIRTGDVRAHQGTDAPGQCRLGHDRHQFLHHGRSGGVSPGSGPSDDPILSWVVFDSAGISPGFRGMRRLFDRHCAVVLPDP